MPFQRIVLSVFFSALLVGCDNDDKNEQKIVIATPTATPIPTPTLTPVPTATPIPTPTVPPTPTPTPTPGPILNPGGTGPSFGSQSNASDTDSAVANSNGEEEEAIFPWLSIGPNNTAFAVWRNNTVFEPGATEAVAYSVWAARYVNGIWQRFSDPIENTDGGIIRYPDGEATSPGNVTKYRARIPTIDMDEDGNAIAVWHQYDGTRTNIWANRFNATLNIWEGAELLRSPSSGYAAQARVTMTTNGNAVVVWHENAGTIWAPESGNGSIRAMHYSSTSGWDLSNIQIISSSNSLTASPNIESNAQGDVAVIWAQGGTWTSRLVNGTWNTEELSSSTADTRIIDQRFPEISINDNGQIIAAWIAGGQVIVNRFDPDTNDWTGNRLLGTGGSMHIHVDNNRFNDAIVTWGTLNTSQIFASHYHSNGNSDDWSAVVDISGVSGRETDLPKVAMDNHGNAVITWHEDGIWVRYYDSVNGWNPATHDINDWDSLAWNPQIGFHDDGRAHIIWRQDDPSGTDNEIRSKVFE